MLLLIAYVSGFSRLQFLAPDLCNGKRVPSPQQRRYTWANPDPQLKPELAIFLQEKITGDSKLICRVSLSVILFHLVLIDSIDFSKLKQYDFGNLSTFFTLLLGNTSLLCPTTSCLEHEIKTLKIFVKII